MRSRIDATIAAVVVLPLVAEITRLPCSSRPASRPIACGSSRVRSLPGSEVPPPRPARRASAPTALAAATLGASRLGDHHPQRARLHAHGGRQVGDRVAVGLHVERAVGVEGHLAAADDLHAGLAHVRAGEDLRERAEVLALGDVADRHDVQHAVVELRVRGEEHAAAEHAGVADRDRVADERARLAVDHDLPARRPPRPHGPQRGVEVDELAELQPRRVGDVAGVGVQARGGDAEVGVAVDVGDVDALLAAAGEHVAGCDRVGPEAELAGEVVAAPAGQHGEHAVGAPQLAGDRAEQPVAAHRRGQLARRERRARELAGVLDRVRALDPEGDPAPAQRRLDGGQQARRPPPARARVDDQADGAGGVHCGRTLAAGVDPARAARV